LETVGITDDEIHRGVAVHLMQNSGPSGAVEKGWMEVVYQTVIPAGIFEGIYELHKTTVRACLRW
jgi:hypothetical protein